MTDEYRGDELKVYRYPSMSSTQENGFQLQVDDGYIEDGQITVLYGEKGSGKSTFLNLLIGAILPDAIRGFKSDLPTLCMSYLFQDLAVDCFLEDPGFVSDLFRKYVFCSYNTPEFVSDVMEPLQIPQLMDRHCQSLSKAEMYNVALCTILAQPALVYLLDEPTFHMDPHQRMVAAHVIRNFILVERKPAIVVEHDSEVAALLADKVIVFEGTPNVSCVASSPIDLDESPLAWWARGYGPKLPQFAFVGEASCSRPQPMYTFDEMKEYVATYTARLWKKLGMAPSTSKNANDEEDDLEDYGDSDGGEDDGGEDDGSADA